MMDHLQKYKIKFNGLKVGQHEFTFSVDDSFFELLDNSIALEGELTIKVHFDKHHSFFILDFEIDGYIKSTCDRCSELFNLELLDDHQLIIKYASERSDEKEEADVMYITNDEIEVNLGQIIYEYIILSVPIQKIHPLDENGTSTCNAQVLKFLEENMEKQKEQEKEKSSDPRWAALNKLKKK